MNYKPLTEINKVNNTCFLAGPCPRAGQKWKDWRVEMIHLLKKYGFNGDTIDPTNPNYDTTDPDYYNKQCTWETTGFHLSSFIIFWVDRNDEHPALTTNIEFGIWSDRFPESVVVGVPEGSEHCNYIKWVCEKKGIKCFSKMEDVAKEVAKRSKRKTQYFFTSDTHFGSSRHLELSRRKFIDVTDMDLSLISNWNKTITNNDVVFHLGDFGDYSILPKLNFGKMYLLKGNYEKDDNDFEITDNRVIVKDNSDKIFKFQLDGETIGCVHEPLTVTKDSSDFDFYLFGHIHEKGKVKRNGYNVGTDANNYAPVNIETIKFYKNAIENFYDDNVFSEKVVLERQ